MGKRKERRLAAKSSTGRRVKLDLFAEPSGDLGGTSAQDEVGGDDYSKSRARLPNSPSSSGQQPENPLSLLGQYSDDDLDEESSKIVNHAVINSSPADFDNQAKVTAETESGDIGVNSGKDLAAQEDQQHNIEDVSASPGCLQNLGKNGSAENDATDSRILHTETALTEQIAVTDTSDIQVSVDMGSSWKMVLHEESNQYYYWNTLSGETSWELPAVLAHGTEGTSESKGATDAEGSEDAVVDRHKANLTLDVKMENAVAAEPSDGSNVANQNCKTEEILEFRRNVEVLNEGYTSEILDDKNGGRDVDQIDALQREGSSLGNFVCSGALMGTQSTAGANVRDYPEHELGRDLCSHLVRQGESLLERLNTLKGSKGRLIGHDKISKYAVEVEIRLCDIKSLSSYGPSLLPFWLHSERQLKQLEAAISDEVLQFYESVEMGDTEAIGKNAVCSTSEDFHSSRYDNITEELPQESHNEAGSNAAANNDRNSLSDSNPGGKNEAVAVPEELIPTAVVHSGEEEVDMDVEMELDDAIPACPTSNDSKQGSLYYAPPEQHPVWPNPPEEHKSFVSEEGFGVPPPPDYGWVPPPPPDNEPVPPPPPDEPPELLYPPPPPPDSVSDLSFTYATQYNVSYPGSSTLEYYGQTDVEAPGSNFYAPDPSQLTIPIQPYYYETLVNAVEPVSYNGIQDETVPPVPGVSSGQSFGLRSVSAPETLGSSQIQSDCTTLPNAGVDIFSVVREAEKKSVEVSFPHVSDQALATISVTQGVSLSSTPAVSVAVAATVPKVQSKVPRNKKRTTAVVSTLRSNKKVSSLVDKWKAAKEEMHEEEDEPENAYEILEKKRQREIEEWHAQQIASGEAKDNANFQPLGSDWRERVKRKRARLMRKSIQASLEESTDGNQQPDLDELSRDLPSRWQAYWDESSKQVYYGNSVTSETTWIRPTN